MISMTDDSIVTADRNVVVGVPPPGLSLADKFQGHGEITISKIYEALNQPCYLCLALLAT